MRHRLMQVFVYRYKASHQVLERAEAFCAQASSTVTAMSQCREHPSTHKFCGFMCLLLTCYVKCSNEEKPGVLASFSHEAHGKQAAS